MFAALPPPPTPHTHRRVRVPAFAFAVPAGLTLLALLAILALYLRRHKRSICGAFWTQRSSQQHKAQPPWGGRRVGGRVGGGQVTLTRF
jgi:hypothetical protein